ncbi:hypothetical protein [Micromonospora ureilytica]|uniref:DUF4232 domain-containing protein n=1 Tax=Micromonospora ureilytica TaxID=709868 RepID=A0ABS0JDH9_9ACTN|nr:hypothetical protein [Micromonospora ureilytica]MBG6065120.1 hypothetical protein [Micromonospora ureilytica]WSR55255.1 hypothetical protein OG400_26250 [Micromonospora ureilytica]
MGVPRVGTAGRAALAGGLALLLMGTTVGCRRSRPSPAPTAGTATVGLTVSAAQPSYRVGEQVSLRLKLVNNRDAECQLSRVPDGAVTVMSLTRDGTAVAPTVGGAAYYRDFTAYLVENLVRVPPRGSVELTLGSDPQSPVGAALTTSAPDGRGGAAVTWWPVDQPGAYRLVLGYLRAPLRGVPADACAATAEQGTVAFEVRGG